jgi:hypothetical protein
VTSFCLTVRLDNVMTDRFEGQSLADFEQRAAASFSKATWTRRNPKRAVAPRLSRQGGTAPDV